MKDLKEKTVRGGFAKLISQGVNFSVRVGSVMVLARLLDPKAFGLVGMVTAVTEVLNLFRDFGLSTATIQRSEISDEQSSTLFWINIAIGTALTLVAVAMAPAIAAFYRQPELVWVTIVLASAFLLNAAGVQHSAVLQREMRFTALAGIDIASLLISTAVGVGMALRGYGYWALVGIAIVGPFISTLGSWLAAAWIPGLPRKGVGIRSMFRFGSTVTLNGLVVYIGYNLEKVLLGRYWGAEAVGLYGRSYQLMNIPTDNLNASVGSVAFPVLSRLQSEPARLKSYFLKCYSFVLALTVPFTMLCALFATDLIHVVLGPKWNDAIPIFRLLAPTMLVFALIDPFAWLMYSLGLVQRSLKIALVIAPLVMVAYIAGLPYGPKGVAFAYSAAMVCWAVPHIAWCVKGTPVSLRDIAMTASRPLLSGLVATVVALGGEFLCPRSLPALPRLLICSGVLFSAYAVMLLHFMGQKALYWELLTTLRRRPAVEEQQVLISA